MASIDVAIIGTGVAGLCCACELLQRGARVTVYEKSAGIGENACSWYAGGMLAPWCEEESAGSAVTAMGAMAMDWWSRYTRVERYGSIVLSSRRDRAELHRFAALTRNHQWLDERALRDCEPDIGAEFSQGLWFGGEAHLNPRQALCDLCDYVTGKGADMRFGVEISAPEIQSALQVERIVDCTGMAAATRLPGLRGVKGEMLVLHTDEVAFSRPIRMLHPRHPVYLVPRDDHTIMLGATMIENDERNRISALSMLELLSTAYALNSALGEAGIVEIGVDVRPAFADNLPSMHREDNVLYVNGLFRHGFLLGPAMAQQAAEAVMDEATFFGLPKCA